MVVGGSEGGAGEGGGEDTSSPKMAINFSRRFARSGCRRRRFGLESELLGSASTGGLLVEIGLCIVTGAGGGIRRWRLLGGDSVNAISLHGSSSSGERSVSHVGGVRGEYSCCSVLGGVGGSGEIIAGSGENCGI